MKKLFTFILLGLSASIGYSQLPTVQYMTPTQYVQDVLAGPGVQVSNVKFNDDPNYTGNRIGKFTYNGTLPMFSSGIVMGSGGVANSQGTSLGMIGQNNSGSNTFPGTGTTVSSDAQLSSILGGSLNEIGRLEFDFVPAGNKVSFQFIFGSDEYNEFVALVTLMYSDFLFQDQNQEAEIM